MGTSLRNPDLDDRSLADRTGFPCAIENPQECLIATVAPHPVAVILESRPAMTDPVPEDLTDGGVKTFSLVAIEGTPSGMQAGEVKGLVGINVADPGDETLGEQRCLDPADAGHRGGEAIEVEVRTQRFGPHAVQGGDAGMVTPVDDDEPTEATLIVEPQDGTVIEWPAHAWMPEGRRWCRLDGELPRHAEVNDELASAQIGQQILPAPRKSEDAIARGPFQVPVMGIDDMAERSLEALADQQGQQVLANGLDLGQLGQRHLPGVSQGMLATSGGCP
jgi:hypothetical protein